MKVLREKILTIAGPMGFVLCVATTSLTAAPGDEHWDPQFGSPGTTNMVLALVLNGDRVYAGGYFGTPAIAETNFVEVWDGTRWGYVPGLEDTTAVSFP